MANLQTNNLIKLSDGRSLSFAEYGSISGKPVIYFHSHPGSRINGRFMHEMAKKNNIKLISPDRPGSGLSDFKPNRKLTDWSQDVLDLADHLQIDNFAVLGASGGGPYALACAHSLSDRVTKTGLLASVGPLDVPGLSEGMKSSNKLIFSIAKIFPKLIPYMISGTAVGVRKNPEKMIMQFKKSFSAIDTQIMNEHNSWEWFIEDLQEAFKKGIQGPSQDVIIYSKNWGFSLNEIQTPVYIWHGEKDTSAPPAMAKHIAEAIPSSHIKMISDFDHLSTMLRYAEEALITICE